MSWFLTYCNEVSLVLFSFKRKVNIIKLQLDPSSVTSIPPAYQNNTFLKFCHQKRLLPDCLHFFSAFFPLWIRLLFSVVQPQKLSKKVVLDPEQTPVWGYSTALSVLAIIIFFDFDNKSLCDSALCLLHIPRFFHTVGKSELFQSLLPNFKVQLSWSLSEIIHTIWH